MEQTGARILIVEDEAIVALDLKVRLQELGHHVCQILRRGEDVLAQINDLKPDLILMDIHLSGSYDGIQTAELLRDTYHGPIIYMTAFADQATIQRAKQTAPAAYLIKPYDLRNLQTAIEIAIHNNELTRALHNSEVKYRRLFSQVDHGIGLFEQVKHPTSEQTSYILIDANPAYYQLLGVTADSSLGKPLTTLHQPDTETFHKLSEQVLATGQPETFELQTPEARWFTVRLFQSEPNRIGALFMDITQQIMVDKREREISLERERVRILREFITAVSHDLRTPLTIINTDAYMAMRRTDNQNPAHATLNRITDQVTRLDTIVNNMIVMAELDSSLLVDTYMAVNLNTLVQMTFETHADKAHERQIEYQLQLGEPTSVMANTSIIWRVFSNLIANAIQFTDTGGRVLVSTTVKNDEFVFAVEDTGWGIPEEDIQHIFKHFYRTDKSRRTTTGGSGLGLAIVKRIVKLHSGRVEAESTPGQGSVFRAYIPVLSPTRHDQTP